MFLFLVGFSVGKFDHLVDVTGRTGPLPVFSSDDVSVFFIVVVKPVFYGTLNTCELFYALSKNVNRGDKSC